jgi:hypothetical protein
MANREKGEAAVEIGGVSYTLSINTNALCEIETLFSLGGKDVSFQDVLKRAAAGQIVAARGVLWGMLRQQHPDITLKKAGELLDQLGQEELGRQLASLASHATPDPTDVATLKEDAPARPPKARGNGRSAAGIGRASSGTRSALA